MKISIQKSKIKNPTETYLVVVKTMEGDADDYHTIEFLTKDTEELREIIIHTNVLMKCFSKNGRGGDDDYVGPYFKKFFEGKLFVNDWGMTDSVEEYSVFYFDFLGQKSKVKIEMDKEMLEEIKHPKMSNKDLEQMDYP